MLYSVKFHHMSWTLSVRRVYDSPRSGDGFRILVDRLWPRGLRSEDAAVERWLPAVAPSKELRKWFGHDPARWDGFKHRYFEELDHNHEPVELLLVYLMSGNVTLLHAARDTYHNNAIALAEYLSALVQPQTTSGPDERYDTSDDI